MPNIPVLNANIIVAVSFEKNLERLIRTVVNIFSHTSARLTLVHVCDPEKDSTLRFAQRQTSAPATVLIQNELEDIARTRLERVASALAKYTEVTSKTLRGNTTKCLSRCALDPRSENRADMIVMGTTKLRGLTTTAAVIAEEVVPVMIIHEDLRLPNHLRAPRILVGDDLGPGGGAAIDWAFKLAELLPDSSILHTHVLSPQNFTPAVIADTRATLKTRFLDISGCSDSYFEGRYDNEVVIGDVATELNKSAAAFQADLAVFSVHKIYHRELSHGGHVSFRSMIDSGRIVLITPPRRTI